MSKRVDHEAINSETNYMMVSVFARTSAVRPEAVQQALEAVEQATEGKDLVIRGWYDVAGFRADADVMVWWHAPSSETLQDAYLALRATELGETLVPVWSQMAMHRAAEFNRAHIPSFLMGEQAKKHVCVYPFVRDSDWYLLPDEDRKTMLRDHGRMAAPYPDVRANTVASFALGDYEWILAFEADELHRIVDLMRDLRGSEARRHMREEQPFFTGRRRELAEIVASWGTPRSEDGCCC
ncbi:hydrogen peroxide-dependent heme synthase [Luteococcus sp. OSA5]|uniref:hydrogen peroxide-dependent heme synthase n=1 Tax=Luteococcus sp. OSA5 TaxID=3401630 RepID=UPI003B436EA2